MKSLSFLAASIALASSAQAATVTIFSSNPQQTTNIHQSLNLGLFDSNLGTLTGASLTLGGSMLSTISLTNNASGAEAVGATSIVNLVFGSSNGAVNTLIAGTPFNTLTVSTGVQTLAVGQTSTFGPLTASNSAILNLSSILASLSVAGGGILGVNCDSTSSLNVTGNGGNIGTSQVTKAGCSSEVVYSYTVRPPNEVPLPGTIGLVGLALAGLGLCKKRKV